MKPTQASTSHRIGFLQAEEITRRQAKTFYAASRFLPKDKRQAAYAIYAICRAADDSVDNAESNSAALNLVKIKEKIERAYGNVALNDNLLSVFRETTQKYKIPKSYFDEMLAGMQMDITKNRYATFDELYLYCYRVAGVIGLLMLKIFGEAQQEAQKYAADLGIALQITNILRDIKEDFARNRIYLPLEEMKRFGVTPEYVSQEKIDQNFIALIKFLSDLAKLYYGNSAKGIRMINSRRCRFVACAIKDIYAQILKEIEKNNYDVYSKRLYVNTPKKVTILLKALFKGQYL